MIDQFFRFLNLQETNDTHNYMTSNDNFQETVLSYVPKKYPDFYSNFISNYQELSKKDY